MKALSIRQPWAWAIVHGGKIVENRRQRWKYRGPILIHAAGQCTVADYAEIGVFIHDLTSGPHHPTPPVVVPPLEELARGGIIGRARIVDVLEPDERACVGGAWGTHSLCLRHDGNPIDPARRACTDGRPTRSAWHMPDQYGYVLEDVVPLPFRPLRGMLGLFEVEPLPHEVSTS